MGNTQPVSGVSKVKVAGQSNEQSELLHKPPPFKSDVVVISGQNSAGKTKDLVEAANMLKFKEALEKQASELNKLYKDNSYDVGAYVEGPIKLKEISKSKIIEGLAQLSGCDVRDMDVRGYTKDKSAISDFRKGVLANLERNESDARTASAILDKIEQLFQNGDFSRIAYVCEYRPFTCTNYLISISKDNQMIALSNTYTE